MIGRVVAGVLVGWATGILAGVLVFGCATVPPTPAPPSCDAFCANLAKLGCATIGPGTCASLCPNLQRPAYVSCVTAARTCGDVDDCDR